MLTINTYLAPSAVHGIGLFAAEEIPSHSVVWKFNPLIDKIYSEQTFLKICRKSPEHSLKHFLNASYRKGGRYFYLTDNARFINHSQESANIAFRDDYCELALRKIMPHEELLENYLMSYDTSDFFFREMADPDPYHYLAAIVNPDSLYAHSRDLS